ncbi:MAG: hypothetical protein U5P10_03525 [Spirochaetia bacterium]|nr:hypothetical protein [Spirochaetia bacterium]
MLFICNNRKRLKLKRQTGILPILLLFGVSLLGAEEFTFKYSEGDKYRILSQVDEEVYVNGQYSHQAEILNRISVEIKDTRKKRGF